MCFCCTSTSELSPPLGEQNCDFFLIKKFRTVQLFHWRAYKSCEYARGVSRRSLNSSPPQDRIVHSLGLDATWPEKKLPVGFVADSDEQSQTFLRPSFTEMDENQRWHSWDSILSLALGVKKGKSFGSEQKNMKEKKLVRKLLVLRARIIFPLI